MENITKGAVVLKSAPTAVDMGLINAQSIRELKAEEVFLFRIAACDNQVDRDFECFSDAALEALSKLFVGRTVLSDHRWSSSGQMARVYAAAVEKESGVIAALRHIHLDPETAGRLGLHDKQMVRVEIGGLRGAVLNNVLVRVSEQYAPEMHIDVEEANALGVKNDDRAYILLDDGKS